MRYRPPLILAILIYLTLDLSLPAMPGAFVFESDDSAETTQVRARSAAKSVALPALASAPGSVLFQLPLEDDDRLAPNVSCERDTRPVAIWSARAHYDSAPPTEDPH